MNRVQALVIGIPLNYGVAVPVQPGQVVVMIIRQKILKTQYMPVIDVRLLIISVEDPMHLP